MTPIELQFATEHGFVSWAIRWRNWSEFSHVDLVLPSGYLIGARSDGGVRTRPPAYAHFSKVAHYSVNVTDEQANRIVDFAAHQCGKPYDYTAIAGFLAHRDWRETDSWFCSELIAAAFEAGGYPLLNPLAKVNRISPRDLMLSPYLKLIGENNA